ncbi:MAG TPA: helicase-related protein, partial [Stenomitos sp.]
SREQRQRTLSLLERGQLRLLYLSPESLLSTVLWERLRSVAPQVNRLVVDEAHCITQWGSSFRPVYRRLGAARMALAQGRAPTTPALAIAAFTATADAKTQQDIQQALDLHQPRVFRSSPYRRNLSVGVTRVYTVAARRDRLLSFIRAQSNNSGLVYTRSRRDSEALALWLTQQGFTTAAYHAGLSAQERRQIEQRWLSGQLRFTICTSAFGMGVDKSDVGWVCHFHPPLTLAEYLQEIGRAGRNGQSAQALLIASEATGLLDPTDKQRTAGFMRQMQQQHQLAQRLVRSLPREGKLQDVLQQEPQAELALALLHRQGALVWLDPFCYRLTTQHPLSAPVNAASALEDYLATRGCRWHFLLAAFGFGREAQGLRCGHCDRCLKKS